MYFNLKFGMFIKIVIHKREITVIFVGWPWFEAGALIMLSREKHTKSKSRYAA